MDFSNQTLDTVTTSTIIEFQSANWRQTKNSNTILFHLFVIAMISHTVIIP